VEILATKKKQYHKRGETLQPPFFEMIEKMYAAFMLCLVGGG
jgi:hypothetical protein